MSKKLDAKFYGAICKVKDDSPVGDDEWVVFLAKDNAFHRVLPWYRDICVDLRCDQEQIDSLDRMIERVERWRKANPDKCKDPDAKGERLLD